MLSEQIGTWACHLVIGHDIEKIPLGNKFMHIILTKQLVKENYIE